LKKILIIRLSSLGDVLLATPLIRQLRQKYPQVQLDFLVRDEYAELLRHHPGLSGLIEFDIQQGFTSLQKMRKKIRQTRYDVILDIHNNLRSRYLCFGLPYLSFFKTRVYRIRKNPFIRFLLVKFKINLYRRLYGRIIPVWEKYLLTARSLGIITDNGRLELYLTEGNIIAAQNFRIALAGNNWEIVIAPGARHFSKRWPEEYFVELIKQLFAKTGLRMVLAGGAEDLPVIEKILQQLPEGMAASSAGKLSLLETAALIKQSKLMISNDSGLMHLGAALDVPLIAIFGSTVEELGFFPNSPKVIVVENRGLYCRPCSHIGRSSCPEKHFRCMREITPGNIISTILQKL
jgi:lipopolysaccharide heptosyltransferase II